MINGETQFSLIKRLLTPAPCYMELSDFGTALAYAYEKFGEYASDITNPERANWWHCMTIIYSSAQLRFGDRPWNDYLKCNPSIYLAIGDKYNG